MIKRILLILLTITLLTGGTGATPLFAVNGAGEEAAAVKTAADKSALTTAAGGIIEVTATTAADEPITTATVGDIIKVSVYLTDFPKLSMTNPSLHFNPEKVKVCDSKGTILKTQYQSTAFFTTGDAIGAAAGAGGATKWRGSVAQSEKYYPYVNNENGVIGMWFDCAANRDLTGRQLVYTVYMKALGKGNPDIRLSGMDDGYGKSRPKDYYDYALYSGNTPYYVRYQNNNNEYYGIMPTIILSGKATTADYDSQVLFADGRYQISVSGVNHGDVAAIFKNKTDMLPIATAQAGTEGIAAAAIDRYLIDNGRDVVPYLYTALTSAPIGQHNMSEKRENNVYLGDEERFNNADTFKPFVYMKTTSGGAETDNCLVNETFEVEVYLINARNIVNITLPLTEAPDTLASLDAVTPGGDFNLLTNNYYSGRNIMLLSKANNESAYGTDLDGRNVLLCTLNYKAGNNPGIINYDFPEFGASSPHGVVMYDNGQYNTVEGNLPILPIWRGTDFEIKAPDEPKPIFYTITFDKGNHGSGSMTSATIEEGKTYYIPECGFKADDGYAFDGWSSGRNTFPATGGKIENVGGNIMLIAQWRYVGGGTTGGDDKPGGGTTGGGGGGGGGGATGDEKPQSATLVINCLDENGKVIHTQKVSPVTIGAIKTVDAPDVEGYVLDDKSPKDITIKAGENIVEFKYKAQSLLNRADHYRYVLGYPDGTIQTDNKITRQEVASIFYRLLTSEARRQYRAKTSSFPDVPATLWSSEAIATIEKANIVTGRDNRRFDPHANITRAEFATIAVRFESLSETATHNFSDVSGHWAERYIASAVERGWIYGYPDGTFMPNKDISRVEAMALINRVLERKVDLQGLLAELVIDWPDLAKEHWGYFEVQEATVSHIFERRMENNIVENWIGKGQDVNFND